MPALTLSENERIAAIKSFLAGSAGGMDGLLPQHDQSNHGHPGLQLIASVMEFCDMY
jgi:hypothetical protein